MLKRAKKLIQTRINRQKVKVMKIAPIRTNQRLANSLEKFSEQGGEKIANYINAAGKFAIAPLVIMYNPFTKESKENKEWAAIKQPVEAVITLGAQLLSLNALYKGIDKLAEKGKIKFKLVEDAIKTGEIPKPILETARHNKEEALNLLRKNCLDIFKDRIGTILTIALYVPVLAISNRIFPKIADWMVKDND